MMFDNIWNNNHIFMGECASNVVFLIPNNFRREGKSSALLLVLTRTDVDYQGTCQERCDLKEGNQFQYRIINDLGNDKIVKNFELNVGEILKCELKTKSDKNSDYVHFMTDSTSTQDFEIGWRSKCLHSLNQIRECVPKFILAKVEYRENNPRHDTGQNVIKTNPVDIFE